MVRNLWLALLAVAWLGLATHTLVIDHSNGAYGISVGSNTAYVSADVVHGIPEFSAQSGN